MSNDKRPEAGVVVAPADKAAIRFKAAIEQLLPPDAIRAVAPKHLTPERVVKVVLACARRNPKIYECTLASVANAVMQAAELGFEAGSALGTAYLVPFQNWKTKETECQLIIGYQGYLELARRSGVISYITVQLVHEKDVYELDVANGYIKHQPYMQDGDPGRLLFAYAKTRYTDGGETLTLMRKDEIDSIMRRSKSWNKRENRPEGPWASDYGEMARKTVLRRHLKTTARSIEPIQRAMSYDKDLREDGDEPPTLTQQVSRAQAFLSRLNAEDSNAIEVPTTPELPTVKTYELPSRPELVSDSDSEE